MPSFLSGRSVRFILLVWAVTRLALVGSAALGAHLLYPGKALVGTSLRWERSSPGALDLFARWDSEWYLFIAAEGYSGNVTSASTNPDIGPEDTTGFFPLYPLAIRCLAPMLGFVGAGLAVSNISLLAAAFLCLALAREIWGADQGSSIGVCAAVLLMLSPFTLFFSAVYAESLFLALSLATMLAVQKGRFAAASALGALSVLARPFGLILVVPMLLGWWCVRSEHRWGWVSLATPAGAMASYMVFCFATFGDPLSFVHRQSRWRGEMGLPWTAFVRWWEEGPRLGGGHTSTVELAFAVVTLGLTLWAIRRLPCSLASYLVVGALLPLTSTLWSYGRITSTLFPIHMALGWLWATRRPGWLAIAAAASFAVALLGMALFAAGYWVG